MWIHQESDQDQFGAGHTPVHPGFQGSTTLDQCATPTLIGHRENKPFLVGAPENIHEW